MLAVETYQASIGPGKLELKNEHQKACPSLKDTLKMLMGAQNNQLISVKSFKYENLLFYRLGQGAIVVSCPCGSTKFTDHQPRFSCARPAAYVCLEKACCSEMCNPKSSRNGSRQVLRPMYGKHDWTRAILPDLERAEERRVDPYFESLLQESAQIARRNLPMVVELWRLHRADQNR
jgi:hypothetical protein